MPTDESHPGARYRVAALYKFATFPDPAALQAPLAACCATHDVRGTLLLAPEGINGTIAGTPDAIAAVVAHIRTLPGCETLDVKYADAAELPFHRMKIRLKREIVTLGVDGLDPVGQVGTYVEPAQWNQLISDPDTIVIDTRNDYEVAIGTFQGAIDPQTRSFREFPAWLADRLAVHRATGNDAAPKIAMFCTGGIRCEKSTALARQMGTEQVFHLKGGILRYLEEVPEQDSLWQGACFVFDERVAVGHGLAPSGHQLCRACRRPLSPDDLQSAAYVAGSSCPHCIGEYSDADRVRFAERYRQVQLASARGDQHIGPMTGDEAATATQR